MKSTVQIATVAMCVLVLGAEGRYSSSIWDRAEIIKGKREASEGTLPLASSIVNIDSGASSASVGAGYSIGAPAALNLPSYPGYSTPTLGTAHLGNLGLLGAPQTAQAYSFAPQTLGGSPFGYSGFGVKPQVASSGLYQQQAAQNFAPQSYAAPSFGPSQQTYSSPANPSSLYTSAVASNQAASAPSYSAGTQGLGAFASTPSHAPVQLPAGSYSLPAPSAAVHSFGLPTQSYGFLSGQGYQASPSFQYGQYGQYGLPGYGQTYSGSYSTLTGLKNSLNNFLSSFARGLQGAASSLGYRPAAYGTAPAPFYSYPPLTGNSGLSLTAGTRGYLNGNQVYPIGAQSAHNFKYSAPQAAPNAVNSQAALPISASRSYASPASAYDGFGSRSHGYDTIKFSSNDASIGYSH